MKNLNTICMTAAEISPAPRPYNERSTNNLLYLKAALEQQGELVPTDLLTALSSRGVIV